MVSPSILAQVRALPAQEQWELVDAVLEDLDKGYSDSELAVAEESLRRYRAHPDDVIDADEAIAQLRRKYL
jgi:predicted DNA-binding protein (UPF0278 family)